MRLSSAIPAPALFGPVPSRRLGISLGVDMIPAKTCPLNCIYCECGATTMHTAERKEYIPAEKIIRELDEYLGRAPKLDHITFGGSGEPTLNTALGTVVRFVKDRYPGYKTALLTNGVLFHLPEVRADAMEFDLVLPSLDAVSAAIFAKINNPVPGISVDRMVEGLEAFGASYRGELLLEIFIIPGINDTPEELKRFLSVIPRLHTTRVQLNALDRPGARAWVAPAPRQRLLEIAEFLKPLPVAVDIIARDAAAQRGPAPAQGNAEGLVLSTLKRRPCTVQDIASIAGLAGPAAEKLLNGLVKRHKAAKSTVSGIVFYSAIE